NKTELRAALRGRDKGLGEMLKSTISAISGTNTILVFDGVDGADNRFHRFLSGLSLELEVFRASKIIIVHKGAERLFGQEVRSSKPFKEMELKGLDRESCKAILGLKRVEKSEFERIYRLTEGNPLALKLIKSEDISALKKSGKYTADELTLIKYLKTLERFD
ncbi:MAG: hypothetical protein JSW28_01340, partial [Thermoplasmata archaeon]